MLQDTYDLIAPVDATLEKINNDVLPLSITIADMELKDQTLLYNYLEYLIDQLETGKKMLGKIQDLACVSINHSMTKSEMDKVTMHGFNWYPKTETHPSIKVDDQPKFIAWCKAGEHAGLVKETVHPQTLKAFVNTLIEEGKPLPPMVGKFEKETVLRRKDKA